jgi:flavin-dependent dehydrogenase
MRVVVLGAGWSGLLAAATVAPRATEVVIVDRDDFSEVPSTKRVRAGAIQGHHAHAVKPRGYALLAELFPGFWEDLRNHGAVVNQLKNHMLYVEGIGWLAHPDLADPRNAATAVACSRPMLEAEVRRRVLALPRVVTRDRTQVLGLTSDPRAVRGVRVKKDGVEETIDADLVVNALGNAFDPGALLRSAGFDGPRKIEVPVACMYLTQRFPLRDEAVRPRMGVLRLDYALPNTSGHPKCVCVVLAQEDSTYLMTLTLWDETLERYRKASSVLEVARAIPSEELQRVIACLGEPLESVRRMSKLVNRLQVYHENRRLPAGYVAVGDQLMITNPIYGLGMTNAAVACRALSTTLARVGSELDANACRQFFRSAYDDLRPGWRYVLSDEVQREPGCAPREEYRALGSYLRVLRKAATVDRRLRKLYASSVDGGTPGWRAFARGLPLVALSMPKVLLGRRAK